MNNNMSIEAWIARETEWAWKYMIERFHSHGCVSCENWTHGIQGCIKSVDAAMKTKEN
jgi:hypothetical protein